LKDETRTFKTVHKALPTNVLYSHFQLLIINWATKRQFLFAYVMMLYGIVTVNNLQEIDYQKEGLL